MSETTTPTSQDVLKQYQDHVFPCVRSIYADPVVVAEGSGCRVTDLDGKTYLDFFGGILTVSVGHANPEVNAAVIAQVGRLSHISTLYPTLPMGELAERLARLSPGNLEKCFFTASGTEADEAAVTLAQVFTGNTELIALRHGYSGRSLMAQALTAHAAYRPTATQVAFVKHALAPYCYRCPLKQTYPKCGVACATDIEDLIRGTTVGKVAGMLAEPIQGVGGFITPPPEYYQIAAEIIRKHGGVFISDEVQTGFGRTGRMWGIENWGVEPDMMTMAKGIANGLPLGALITTGPIADSFTKSTISTFGGNPVSCAAANATLGIIERENLTENCARQGELLRAGLERLQGKYPKWIGDVRGMGLMQALEIVVDETVQDRTPDAARTNAVLAAARDRGLLIGKGGLYGNVMRIAPMLNTTAAQIEEALTLLDDAFASL